MALGAVGSNGHVLMQEAGREIPRACGGCVQRDAEISRVNEKLKGAREAVARAMERSSTGRGEFAFRLRNRLSVRARAIRLWCQANPQEAEVLAIAVVLAVAALLFVLGTRP